MGAIKGVTALKAQACENCWWVPSLCGTTTILPGHRYLLHTALPGDEGFDALERPFSVRECASCVEPCVLPFQVTARQGGGHEHVCKRCMHDRAEPQPVASAPYQSGGDT